MRSKLRRMILGVKWRMRGLWAPLAVSSALAGYGVSGLPGHVLVALVACIPLVVAWRGRVAARTSQFTAALSISKDGIVLTDMDSNIVAANPVFEDISGRASRDLVGRPLSAILQDRSLGSMINRAIAEGSAAFARVHVRRQAFDAEARPILHDGCAIGLTIVLRGMYPNAYEYRESPQPRPRSTVSLRELLGWLVPFDSDRLGSGEINPVVRKCLNDPEHAGKYGSSGSAEPDTAEALYALIRLLEPKNVIEIGSYVGASSICMAQALAHNARSGLLHCVDLEEAHVTLTGDHLAEASLSAQARLYHGSSQDPEIIHSLPRSELIFIDGDHTYEGARKDFDTYEALLGDDGIIVFHDTIKIMALQRLMMEIAQDPRYDTISIATSDGDGLTLIRRRAGEKD